MGYGRRMKGKARRIPITVHVGLDLIEVIDNYVDERGGVYSRSDFYAEAATAYLKLLGYLPEEETKEEGVTKA